MAHNDNPTKSHSVLKSIGRFFIVLLTTLLLIVCALLLLMFELAKGPSKTAQELFVCSVKETSAIGFLADMFYSEEQIAEFIGNGRNNATDEVTDTSLIQIGNKITHETNDTGEAGEEENTLIPDEPLSVVDITGKTFKGKLMIVRDPSRVKVGISGEYGGANEGRTVLDMMNSYGAVGATNAGGFDDPNGVGNGGTPLGLVISDGELRWGSLGTTYELIGFDKDNILHVGNMTGQQALDANIRDAICFGPMLIVNGNPQNADKKLGGGFNPRSAIGQTADGTVLLLVIDGRQPNSVGATYDDLVTIMQQYGAVNAANLDGGSSALMYHNGELITTCSSLYGPRKMPTCILVLP